MATRKTIMRVDKTRPVLKIEDGKVIEVEPVGDEIVVEESEEENGLPVHRITTPNGEAIYKYVGNCWDCKNERVEMPLFKCTTKVRADDQIGNQLAGFWNDGELIPLCQEHYRRRLGQLPKQDTHVYKVIEKTW